MVTVPILNGIKDINFIPIIQSQLNDDLISGFGVRYLGFPKQISTLYQECDLEQVSPQGLSFFIFNLRWLSYLLLKIVIIKRDKYMLHVGNLAYSR